MIETAKYITIMSQILKEASVGNFRLKKKVIPKGAELQMYIHPMKQDHKEGK